MRQQRRPALLIVIAVLLALGVSRAGSAQAPSYPGKGWSWPASPEQLGWSTDKLKEVHAYAATIKTAAVMIVVVGAI